MTLEAFYAVNLLTKHIAANYSDTGVLVIFNDRKPETLALLNAELGNWGFDIPAAFSRQDYILIEIGVEMPTIVENLFKAWQEAPVEIRYYKYGKCSSIHLPPRKV